MTATLSPRQMSARLKKRLPRLELLAAAIQAIISEGRTLFTRVETNQWQALALARFRMIRALDEFIQFQDESFLTPISVDSEKIIGRIASIIRERNSDLQAFYDKFVQRWLMTSPICVTEFYLADASIMGRLISDTIEADVASVRRMLKRLEANDPDLAH